MSFMGKFINLASGRGLVRGLSNAIGYDLMNFIPGYTAGKNLDLQKENLAYQKDLQQQIFNREDNAVQRKVADLQLAGLSPVLAAGQAANAGMAVQTQAPQMGDMGNSLLPVLMDIAHRKTQIEATVANTDLAKSQKNSVYWQNKIAELNYNWFKDAGLPTTAGVNDTITAILEALALFKTGSQQGASTSQVDSRERQRILEERIKEATDKAVKRSLQEQLHDERQWNQDVAPGWRHQK